MKKKVVYYFICTGFLFFILVFFYNYFDSDHSFKRSNHKNVNNSKEIKKKNDMFSCYFEPSVSTTIKELKDEELKQIAKIGQHIFFIETSCPENGKIDLNPRQACAIESAAKMNPGMDVYVLFLSSEELSHSTKEFDNLLQTYGNIYFRRIIMDDYVKNTPLEAWWASGVFKTTRWPREHMSDVLRYLTLWKFPGIYSDLDMVIMASLENFVDFAGAENSERVNSAVLGFGKSNIGRKVAQKCLERILNNFRGDLWTHNGPDVITYVLKDLCKEIYMTKIIEVREMETQICEGFTIFPPSAFYPLFYSSWEYFFENDYKDETMKTIRNSLGIHLWNKLSHSKPIYVGQDVPYAVVASQYCPKIYYNCGKTF